MISRMLGRDPDERPSFDHILNSFRGSIFPEYFYTFLKDYVNSLSDTPDSANTPDGFSKRVANQPGTKIDRLLDEWESVSIHLDQGGEDGGSFSKCQFNVIYKLNIRRTGSTIAQHCDIVNSKLYMAFI